MVQEWRTPSASLRIWLTDRLPRIAELEKQCTTTTAPVPPNPRLEDENLRGLIILLSAHFQGFCRDLCTECTMILSARIRNPSIRSLFQEQFTANRKLDQGDPNLGNIRKDFERFGFTLDLPRADPGNNPRRITHLSSLNQLRNVAAHHGNVPSGGIPDLATIQAWRNSCEGLATSLDGVMYNELLGCFNKRPWKP
ncbi:HEPN domain-containing protein [Singulisphaera rosea]